MGGFARRLGWGIIRMADGIRQAELARMLRFKNVRTIQRRRHEAPEIYAPDYIDRTHHPRWLPATVEKIIDWEKGSK